MNFNKTIVAVVTGLIGFGILVVDSPSSAITSTEWIAGAIALATAIGVYAVPNQPAR